jgi:hypothetical protein
MRIRRARRGILLAGLLAIVLAPGAHAQQREGWTLDPSLYLFIPGLTGTVGIGPIDVDLNEPSTAILSLNFGAMGSIRLGYDAWALTTDVLYADVGATKDNTSGSVQALIVEPTVSYRVRPWVEALAGIRYDRIGGTIEGPFGQSHAAAQGWIDPIVGLTLHLPLGEKVSLDFRGDVGGFGVGSKFTWQAFPYVRWRAWKTVSLQGGYRVLAIDFENGSGIQRVKYDVVLLGPQLGVTFLFDL